VSSAAPSPLRIAAGHASDLVAGTVRVVRLPPDGRIPREALIVRDERGALRAYLNLCQHLPIPLDGGSRRFLTRDAGYLQCGTHGARYRLSDGHCVEGPCQGRALITLELEQSGDDLSVLLPA
jgi:nitrite reductase/ring-hydroxylating ferredoxin subunit